LTGRGYYEALDRDIALGDGEWAARCQLVTTDGTAITDPSGGNTSTTESRQLIQKLNDQANLPGVSFHFGNRSNHLVTVKGDFPAGADTLLSPWEVIGRKMSEYVPAGGIIGQIVARSREVLADAEVNLTRRDLGENEANMAYIYGAGQPVTYPSIEERLGGVACGLVSYSSMARGLARAVKVSRVLKPEESGSAVEELRHLALDAKQVLDKAEIVIVHVSFPDKYATRRLGLDAKVQGIERIDEYLVKPLAEYVAGKTDIRLAVVPTLVSDTATRQHLTDAVPVLVSGGGIAADGAQRFDEATGAGASLKLAAGTDGVIAQLRAM
ncbi:MAG: hypothetical protein AB7K09_20675, partial [Planctomycetota bacterium]